MNVKHKIFRLSTGTAILAAAIILERLYILSFLSFGFFIAAYLILGYDVLTRAIKNITRGQVFDENFLMSIATIGAFAIGESAEAVAVMLFYQIGEAFQDAALEKSKKSITSLMDLRPDYANLLIGEEIEKVSPDIVQIGNTIIVKPGEKIPLDGKVIEGKSMLDTSALTGESVPCSINISGAVLSGCINLNGVLKIKVTKTSGQSTVARIIDLVENASSKKAPTENFITTFARYYTPIVVGLAILIAFFPPLLGFGEWAQWINRGLIFLVISCPCALVVSIPLGFFGGIGGASRKGILVKGGNYLEALNNLDTIVFDKTGTLTKGVFKVTNIQSADGFSKDEVLELAANAEIYSNHPIALSILNAFGKEIDKTKLTDYNEVSGYGVSVMKDGRQILAGNKKLMETRNIHSSYEASASCVVYVAVEQQYAGCIIISDELKPDSKETITALKAKGIQKTVMLTGDNSQIAEEVANELGIDEVFSGLLPHEKVEKLEMLQELQKKGKRKKTCLAFVGDGVNDAPVLSRADVGIAMGGLGQDAAIEAADVVLMTDEPSKLIDAVNIARFTKRVVRQNIIVSLGVKAMFLILGVFGMASLWEAVFADVGVALLAVLNAMRVIRSK